MLPARSLNGSLRRKAEDPFLPWAFSSNPMMRLRVPDEIDMQQWPQIVPFFCLLLPRRHSMGIKHIDDLAFGVVLCDVGPKQIPNVLDYLIPQLHSHALLGDRFEQRPQHHLGAVSLLIAGEIRSNAPDFIAGHECSTGANHHVVQVVADRKLLRDRRILKLFLKLWPGQRHESSSISVSTT